MNQEEKLFKIIDWYSTSKKRKAKSLSIQKDPERIHIVEDLIGEPLPHDIAALYTKYDGDEESGSFLGHSLVSLEEMRNSLEFSKSMVKPTSPKIVNPEISNAIISEMIKLLVDDLPSKLWYKVEFECSPTSFGGPYLYISEKEREIIDLSEKVSDGIMDLAKKLHANELDDYNWDSLEITAFKDGNVEANRTFYNFDEELPLTSTPDGAIKKKYFHIKWIPLTSDSGGNYIGIDLDPDEKGTKGQVIIFGRDEEDMFVLANSWNEFLDYNLEIINKGGKAFNSQTHLHDIYKKLKIS